MIGFTMGGTPPPDLTLVPETSSDTSPGCYDTGGCSCDGTGPTYGEPTPTPPSEDEIRAILNNDATVRAKFGLPQKSDFTNNTEVNVTPKDAPTINGVIKGKANIDVFDVYIVQIDQKDHPADLNYPFDCITIPEQALTRKANSNPTIALVND